MNKLWDSWNKGVSLRRTPSILYRIPGLTDAGGIQRQWKDIRHKYVEEE